jgi:nitrate/nitrite transporter NarK
MRRRSSSQVLADRQAQCHDRTVPKLSQSLTPVSLVCPSRNLPAVGVLLERRYHVAVPALASAAALALLATSPSAFFSMTLLCFLAAGVLSCRGSFWALPTEFLSGYSAAASIALINSIGNLAGFVSPVVIGFAAERTGSLSASLALAAVPVFPGCSITVAAEFSPRAERPIRQRIPLRADVGRQG